MAGVVDKENAVLGRPSKASRAVVPLSPTRKPGTPINIMLRNSAAIDEAPAPPPVHKPDERLTTAKRGAHAVVPAGLAPEIEVIKLRNALINEQEDKKQYVMDYERIHDEGRELFKTYVAKCNRLKEVSADAAKMKQMLTEKTTENVALMKRVQDESAAATDARNKQRTQAEDFRANFAAFRALKEENETLKAELAKERDEAERQRVYAEMKSTNSKELDEMRTLLAIAEAARKEAKDSADLAMVLARDRAARLEGIEAMQRATGAKQEAAAKYLSEQLRDRDAQQAAAQAQYEAELSDNARVIQDLTEKLRSAEAELKLAEGLLTSAHEEAQQTLQAAQAAKSKAEDDCVIASKRASEAERCVTEERTRREECVSRLDGEREARQRAELVAEERLAGARAQLESAEANLQRITAHANERVRNASELLESERAKARDREAEQSAVIASVRADLEKERNSTGARLADAERKFAQLQRHTRTLLADKEKAVRELADGMGRLRDVESGKMRAEEALAKAKERVSAVETEVMLHRQRNAGYSAAVTKAQDSAREAGYEVETLRIEIESCRSVLRHLEREATEASQARDIALHERAQLVLQLELLMLLSAAAGDVQPALLQMAQDHFALQREQAALHSRHDTAVREAERLRRELLRLARHAQPRASSAPVAEAAKV